MSIALQLYDRERRIREYKSDSTIEGFRKIMFKIYCYAQPRIVICISNPEKSVFDIDPVSKERIEWWKEQLEKYIKLNYSDIIQ